MWSHASLTPGTEDMEKLVELAHDKEEWNIIVNKIKTTQALDVMDF